ncbi:hypothetical protein C5167_003794 [Papaver somniferum]|uniref:Uncharacterized protein n=1 Tax=Papaver somniferum TaxID=3469 RepID=A0A4Y7L4K1_PAPSO|nr:hypothetical protein C5167_003794 [Papaver somniferum]
MRRYNGTRRYEKVNLPILLNKHAKDVLYCAKKAGVTHIQSRVAQAILAMVWGTPSCPKVENF